MEFNTPNQLPAFSRSQSTDGTFINVLLPRGILLTHSSTLPTLTRPATIVAPNNIVRVNFQRRTMDGARQLRDNFQNIVREIQPLVETARTVNISSFLNRPQSEPNIQNPSNSFVINVDESSTNDNANQVNNIPQENVPENIENTNNEIVENEEVTNNVETQYALSVLQKYVPFILILLAKCIYDHHEGILNVIVLFAIFTHANSVIKKEATKRGRRSLIKLLLASIYIVISIVFIHYIFDEEKLYLNLIFIRTYDKPLMVWDLLWYVGITDFILKLITVFIKIALTALPAVIVPFQKRGKIYLFMEAVSQLYRSLATIQPWLYYLLEFYQGPEKIVGVFLSASYMVSKGADIMSKLKLLKHAIFKLIQNVAVGSSPSKEQIQTAGEHCPICHDEYESPVLLQCRHIFCESCVTTWFDREQTCPLCRSKIVDDPSWRDGSTTYFMQLF